MNIQAYGGDGIWNWTLMVYRARALVLLKLLGYINVVLGLGLRWPLSMALDVQQLPLAQLTSNTPRHVSLVSVPAPISYT